MHSFYLAQEIKGDTTTVSDVEQLHHLRNVLRLKVGDEVTVFDAEGNEYLCKISLLEKKQAVLIVENRNPAQPQRFRIAVACAIPKQCKMDDIIDKLTQLGIDTIIPMLTERVIVKLEDNKESRLARWRKIALSAAEQSHRRTLPRVSEILEFKEVIVQSRNFSLKLIPTLEGERKTIKEMLLGSVLASILILIGPEGDFTPQEINEAVESGFIPISLGESVLRVDTAAIAVASYIKMSLQLS